jgi:hypothetical protein
MHKNANLHQLIFSQKVMFQYQPESCLESQAVKVFPNWNEVALSLPFSVSDAKTK